MLLAYVIELTGRSPSSQVRGKRTPRKSPKERQKGSLKGNSSVESRERPDVAEPESTTKSMVDDSDSGEGSNYLSPEVKLTNIATYVMAILQIVFYLFQFDIFVAEASSKF